MKLFCVVLLLASAYVGVTPLACPTGFGTAPAAAGNPTLLSATCSILCGSQCVTDPSNINQTTTCLNLTAVASNSDFHALRKIKTPFCVIVSGSNIRKPLVLGDGNDCVQVMNNSQVTQIITGDGNDFVNITSDSKVNGKISTGKGDDYVLVSYSTVADVATGAGDDFVNFFGNAFGRDVNLGRGNDVFYSHGKTAIQIQEIDGSLGDDLFVLYNTTVTDELNAGPGSDYIALTNNTHIRRLDLGKGIDVVGAPALAMNFIDEVADDDDQDSDDIQCVIPV